MVKFDVDHGGELVVGSRNLAGVRLPPVGFWSYARQDDDKSNGRLSQLRSLLQAELQQLYGRELITIFQDVSTIPTGAEWERDITEALGRSSFIIPIITPAFIQSEWCCKEVQIFLDREKEINEKYSESRNLQRVFPISYISISGIDNPYDADIVSKLKKLQWFRFEELRLKDYRDYDVSVQLSRLAAEIMKVLNVYLVEARGAGGSAEAIGPATLGRDPGAHELGQSNDEEEHVTLRPPAPPRITRRVWRASAAGLAIAAIAVGARIWWPRPAVTPVQAAVKGDAATTTEATAMTLASRMQGRWRLQSTSPDVCSSTVGKTDGLIGIEFEQAAHGLLFTGYQSAPTFNNVTSLTSGGWLQLPREGSLWRMDGSTLLNSASESGPPVRYIKCPD